MAGKKGQKNQPPRLWPMPHPATARLRSTSRGGHQLRIVGSYDPEALARLIRGLSK